MSFVTETMTEITQSEILPRCEERQYRNILVYLSGSIIIVLSSVSKEDYG